MQTISHRELRNHIGKVLRRVESGERLTVTVDGRPVADLVPLSGRHTFVPRDMLTQLLTHAPLDRAFTRDLDAVTGATIDEL